MSHENVVSRRDFIRGLAGVSGAVVAAELGIGCTRQDRAQRKPTIETSDAPPSIPKPPNPPLSQNRPSYNFEGVENLAPKPKDLIAVPKSNVINLSKLTRDKLVPGTNIEVGFESANPLNNNITLEYSPLGIVQTFESLALQKFSQISLLFEAAEKAEFNKNDGCNFALELNYLRHLQSLAETFGPDLSQLNSTQFDSLFNHSIKSSLIKRLFFVSELISASNGICKFEEDKVIPDFQNRGERFVRQLPTPVWVSPSLGKRYIYNQNNNRLTIG